nr:FtsX-like permease family protein [Gammaproteobacteria bacterium]
MPAGPRGLAGRWLRREWRGGEVPLLAVAVLLAVASASAVGFFADRVRGAMSLRATELLAADLVLVSSAPIEEARRQAARERGLNVTETLTFPSMVAAGDRLQLAEVKAVGPGYPLRGELRVAPAPFAADTPRDAGPGPGSAWVDARLATALGVAPGRRVQVGAIELAVTEILAFEPDRPGDLFSLGPRLMMHLDDVPASGLVQPGSRVTHRLLVAGTEAAVADYRGALQDRLGRGEGLQGVRDTRPELRIALDRAERFLGLAALVSALLAGVAVALAARRYAERHLDTVAVLRCLGATQGYVTRLFATQLLLVGLTAGAVGAGFGYLAQGGLAVLLAEAYPGALPVPSPWPAVAGMATGLVTLAGFALPPLLRLREVPPLRVLRRDLAPLPAPARWVYGSALLALGALVLWQAGDARLAGYVLAGAAATVVVLVGAAYVLVTALRPLRARVGVSWRFGLARIARGAGQSVVQVAAFGLGLMVLLLLTVVRGELIDGWRDRLPPDAPNYFLINVQPDEVAGVRAFLAAHAVADTALYPMVRGRLVAIDGRPVSADDYEAARAKRLVEREFNLSTAAEPQEDNRVTAGRWWSGTRPPAPQLSVEEGLAETLGITLGSRLRFQVAGQEVE